MTQPFTLPVTVGKSDLDEFGHTNNVVYLGWLERVAWAHSQSLGLGMDDYRRLNAGCVVRKHELEYLAATFEGDALILRTWIAENDAKLSVWRRYDILRPADGKTILRARTQWICIDMKSGKPKRQPPEFIAAYQPLGSDPN